MRRKRSDVHRSALKYCRLSKGTGTEVRIRIADVIGVEVDLTIAAIEVEVRSVGELASSTQIFALTRQ